MMFDEHLLRHLLDFLGDECYSLVSHDATYGSMP
jgi:hypothetical protein